ncbi:hypothetical protein SUH3_13210 [Pseudosulfitobacter pseudonitzschiae]|uniref:TnsA endonuclease N-terminal domain-containing protein n=1 Tax=Pseudosulfitobacter pseudonitzschiae TaxID=1402135 RepID=A0A073IVE0_9RHOB|nr:hypothetical protein SUH3_13210 [Pseudosulfitobacter pseudonitzschiae]
MVTVDCESRLEDRTRSILLAQPGLHDLREQYPRVEYHGNDGVRRWHTFDFMATYLTGRRIAIAVKPKKLSDRRRFFEELVDVEAALPRRVADEVRLVTDDDIDRTEATNAARYLHFARDTDPEADAWLTERLRRADGQLSVSDLINESDMGGRMFRAVFRAIYVGHLRADRRSPITVASVVFRESVQ